MVNFQKIWKKIQNFATGCRKIDTSWCKINYWKIFSITVFIQCSFVPTSLRFIYSDSSKENLDAYFQKYNPLEKDIYKSSNIKYKNFVGIYIKEFVDFDIAIGVHNRFLKFIRVILPSKGLNIPKTNKSLVKTYNLSKGH